MHYKRFNDRALFSYETYTFVLTYLVTLQHRTWHDVAIPA